MTQKIHGKKKQLIQSSFKYYLVIVWKNLALSIYKYPMPSNRL